MSLAPTSQHSFVSSVKRASLATLGPVLVAAANFLLTLQVLRHLPPQTFGEIAFLMVIMQFGMSLSNALVCTPYSAIVNRDAEDRSEVSIFFSANFWLSALLGLAGFLVVFYQDGLLVAVLAGLFLFFAIIRWFLRSHYFAAHSVGKVANADFIYAAVVLMAVVYFHFHTFSSAAVMGVFLAASLAAVCSAPQFLRLQFAALAPPSWKDYRPIWINQSRWSLTGVTTTELTSNVHAWLVTLWMGPNAFAPIAAAALFFRPHALVLTSLTQLERPRMVRQLAENDKLGAKETVGHFRLFAITSWFVVSIAGAIFLYFWPKLILKSNYELRSIWIAFVLTVVINLSVSLRMPEAVFLQANDKFKMLAIASAKSGLLTLILCFPFVFASTPTFTLFAVLVGQIYLAVILQTKYRDGVHGG